MVEVLKTLTSIITGNMFGNHQMKMLIPNLYCHETFLSLLFVAMEIENIYFCNFI